MTARLGRPLTATAVIAPAEGFAIGGTRPTYSGQFVDAPCKIMVFRNRPVGTFMRRLRRYVAAIQQTQRDVRDPGKTYPANTLNQIKTVALS